MRSRIGSRPHRRLIAVTSALAFSASLAACGGSGSGSGSGNAVVAQVGGPPETSGSYPGALLFPKTYQKPNVSLEDTAGAPYNVAADTGHRLTLVYFGYTHCPDLCPLNMFTAATAIGRLPQADRSKVTVVFITTDPDRDSPSVIRTWLDHFDDQFIGLTGTVQQIREAETSAGIPLSIAEHTSEPGGSYTVVHAGYIIVYTQDDRAHLEFPAEISPSQEASDLARLLRQGWQA